VGDEDDGLAEAAGEGAEFTLELGAGNGIERAEGLVHQKNGRIGGQSARDADALTLAAGKFAGAATREFARIEPDELEHFFDAGGSPGSVPAFQSGNKGDVFCDGEMREKTGVLNDIPNAATEADGIPSGGRAALNEDFPIRGKEHSVHQPEKSGLAAAAAAEEDEGLTVRDFQGDAVNDYAGRSIVDMKRNIAKLYGPSWRERRFRIHFD
jgi:hypothetical protein